MQKKLLDQAETHAQQLNISTIQFIEIAVENFIKNYQDEVLFEEFNKAHEDQLDLNELELLPDSDVQARTQMDGESIVINQGDIFWIRPENSSEAELGYYPHPYVVIQDNLFNHSRIHSVVVCTLTSNLQQANAPGNVLLESGEANLPKQSAVIVSKVSAVNKSQLGKYIGSLNEQRVNQVLAGIRFLQVSFFAR